MNFADETVLVIHTQDGLQCLMDRFSKVYKKFPLTITIKKTKVLAQNAEIPPTIYIDGSKISFVAGIGKKQHYWPN